MWTLSGFADEIDPELDKQCQVLSDLQIRYMEFRSAWGINVLDLDDAQLAEAKTILTRHQIAVSSVGSPIGKVSVRDDFDQHLHRFDRALHVASVFQAPYIRLFSFYPPEGDDPASHRDAVMHRMSTLANRAAGHDVVLLHENERGIYGDIPERCRDIVESVGAQNLRLAWDAANYVLVGVRPFTDGYTRLRGYTDYVQVKDAIAATGEIVAAGEGDGEIAETNRALRADGFDGFFSMEPHLAQAGHAGGYSGPELFAKATRAFTGLLDADTIDYR